MTSFVDGSGANRCRSAGDVAAPVDIGSRGSSGSPRCRGGRTSSRRVASRRLCDTAVTPSDRSIENATISEYDGSLPTSVMSVPCSVVTTRGARGRRLEHLLRQERRRRVRDGVVGVDDLELELARDLHDLVRERQHVLRLAEERIARRVHLMERQAGLVFAEPERRIGADEVHLVAALGERLGQLGRDDAAAADRGVADDADVHGITVRRWRQLGSHALELKSVSGATTGCPVDDYTLGERTPASAPNCASRLSTSCWKSGVVSRVWTDAVGRRR